MQWNQKVLAVDNANNLPSQKKVYKSYRLVLTATSTQEYA